ncbi:hypothetical protein [Flavobacterium sp.]|jgi:hypothetical protein|uniref:hypothetical protein n=1 Tax=Flavobacterium sp. TaxID=239 RepID=UPI0037C0439F
MTSNSIQSIILSKIQEVYLNAAVKKIDKDNFLDILPSNIDNIKDCLFLNTKNESAIKIGLTSSNKDIVNKLILADPNLFVISSTGLKCTKSCSIDEAIEIALNIIQIGYSNNAPTSNTINNIKSTVDELVNKPIETNASNISSNEGEVKSNLPVEQDKLVNLEFESVEANKEIEKNSEPSNIGNLFQKGDYLSVCYHTDIDRKYSNNTLDKIIVAAVNTQNSFLLQLCKEKIEKLGIDFKYDDRNFGFVVKWEEYFAQNSHLLKPETEYEGDVNQDNKPEGIGKLIFLKTGGIYEGMFLNGVRHGKGKHTWKNGDVYEGEWAENKRTGNGKMIFANNDVYDGEWVENRQAGRGKFISSDGDEYEGYFFEGKRKGKGKGKELYSNGDLYEGDFVDGKRTGKGKFISSNGDVYEGDFVDGKRTGKGKFISSNGDVYEGDFVDSKPSGKGKFIWSDGDVYEGDFVDGKRTGKGKLIWSNGNIYQGDYVDGTISGKGKFNWSDGDVYEGDFVNGIRNGKGKFIWLNGNIYEGDLIDGTMSGKGKFISSNGDLYEGDYFDGKKHGYGKLQFANGDSYDGQWKDGTRIGLTKFEISQEKAKEDAEREKNRAKEDAENEINKAKEDAEREKNKARTFQIDYKIKLTKSKSTTHLKGSEFGIIGVIFNGGKTKEVKTHDRGETIERNIRVKHIGKNMPNNLAKHFIEENDNDVKSGNAGSSTILILSIKEVS